MRIRAGLLAVAIVASTGMVQAQLTEPLRYKFKEGEKLVYQLEHKTTIEMQVLGNDVSVETNQKLDMTRLVSKVTKDGTATMVQKIERLHLKSRSAQGAFEFDTNEDKVPDNPIVKKLYEAAMGLVAGEVTLQMTARGQIEKVTFSEKMEKALKDAGGANEMATPEGMKKVIEQASLVLPAEIPTKGKAWTGKVEVKSPVGKLLLESKCIYDGPSEREKQRLEKVSIRPSVSLEPDPKSSATMKIQSVTGKGAAFFDAPAGRLHETEAVLELEMEFTSQGQTIKQTVKNTTTMKLIEAR